MLACCRMPAVAALAAAACVALVTPAAAAPVLPTPTTFGTSPAPLSGSASDPCGFSAPYGYIGTDDITFSAVINVPAGGTAAAEFLITPGDGSAPLDFTTAALPSGQTTEVVVPRADFTDGTTYAWQVRETDGSGDLSPYTQACHFISDHTPPPQPAVTSSVFTSSNPPVARTPGTFTFSVPGGSAGASGGLVFIPGVTGGGFGSPVTVSGTKTNWSKVTGLA
jgi:hypothetical protein